MPRKDKFHCKLRHGIVLKGRDDTGLMEMPQVIEVITQFVEFFEARIRLGWNHNCGRYSASYKEGRRVPTRITLTCPDHSFGGEKFLEALRPALEKARDVEAAGGDLIAFDEAMKWMSARGLLSDKTRPV